MTAGSVTLKGFDHAVHGVVPSESLLQAGIVAEYVPVATALSAWMVLSVQVFEALTGHMRVNLRRR